MRAILIALLMALATQVWAEEDNPLGITFYGSFLHTKQVPNALFFFNEIDEFDGFELRRAIRDHNINVIVLGSDGGNVWEGLSMAGLIHDKGLSTYVPHLPEGRGCYSACAFMFFAGKMRKADGILAVHQVGSYGTNYDKSKAIVSETQQGTQSTVSEIIGFLNEFETPPFVFEKMFRSRNFHEFTEAEKSQLETNISEKFSEQLRDIDKFSSEFFAHLQILKAQQEAVQKTDEESDTVEVIDQYKEDSFTDPQPVPPPKIIIPTDYFIKEKIYTGPPVLPDFSGRDKAYRMYRTRIKNGITQGVNFAARFAIIEIGCGTMCRFAYLADVSSGEVFGFPFGGEENYGMQLSYSAGSTLIKVSWIILGDEPKYDANEKRLTLCAVRYISWIGKTFEVILEDIEETTAAWCQP